MVTKAKTKPKPAPRAKKQPPPPITRDGLLSDIASYLNDLDAFMSKRKKSAYNLSWSPNYPDQPLYSVTSALRVLGAKLEELEAKDGRPNNLEAVIRERFESKPGEPLSWSRPGSFLAWMGEIPVRCCWGGYYDRHGSGFYALSRTAPFLSSPGYFSADIYAMPQEAATPEDVLRQRLALRVKVDRYTGRRPQSQLVVLNADGRGAVAAFLSDPANAWWAEAVRQQPSDAVPLSANVATVQTSLFGS